MQLEERRDEEQRRREEGGAALTGGAAAVEKPIGISRRGAASRYEERCWRAREEARGELRRREKRRQDSNITVGGRESGGGTA